MAASAEKIEESVFQDLVRQREERRTPNPDVLADLEEQRRLRNGDYPLTTIPGIAQGAIGVVENIGTMMSGFFGAAPATIAGLARGANARGTAAGAGELFLSGFEPVSEALTYEPRTVKGKKILEAIEGAYTKYIQEKWFEHIAEQVDAGVITPEEATYFRVSADALLLGLPIAGTRRFSKRGEPTRDVERDVEVDLEGVEGEYIPSSRTGLEQTKAGDVIEGELAPEVRQITEQKKLPAPEQKKLPAPEQKSAAQPDQTSMGELAEVVAKYDPAFAAKADAALAQYKEALFRNRQAGAIDPKVFKEGVQIALRPVAQAVKASLDLSHALARQVGFKHVSDIRNLHSPTAKMLADRIMPLEDSKIPLGGGFHELVSLKEGEYNTRIDNILSSLRKHVANENSIASARLVALPKQVNDSIINALETGKVPQGMLLEARAIKSILRDIYEYQRQAGVSLTERPGYFPHLWDAKKIARMEYMGDKSFYNFLTEKHGFTPAAARQTIQDIIHEEGFLDFIEDTGGRLTKGADYGVWSRANRVGGGPASPSHTRGRKIETTVQEARKFLITDLEAVLTNYVRKAVNNAEYVRIAGPKESKLNSIVRQIIEEEQVAAVAGAKTSSPHATAQKIYDVFDAMQHRFHQIQNPAVRATVRAVSGFEVMAHLGLVSLAQLPETLMPAVKYRVATTGKHIPVPLPFKSYAAGMAAAINDGLSSLSTVVTGKPRIPKSELRKHLERVGVIKVSALESSASRMMTTSGVMTNRFIRTVLMEAVTDMQRMIALDTIQSMVRQNAKYLAKGKGGKRAIMYRQELTELGLPPEEVIAWYKDGMPKDHPIQHKLDIAVVRGVDTTIIMPKAANAPRLYNDPRFQPILLFTRFFSAFGNTVIKGVFKKMVAKEPTNIRKMASLSMIAASIATAYYTQFLREDITGYQVRDEDDPLRVVDAVDRAGWLGAFTRLYPLVSEYRYGVGPSYITNLLGGPIGTDIAKGIEASKGTNKQKARYLASMTPIANITPEVEKELEEFYLELLNEIEP